MTRRVAVLLLAVAAVAAGAAYAAVYQRPWLVDTIGGPDARSELVPRPCGFTTQSGRTMVCYDLRVPENRARAGSRLLTLPVLVFEAPEKPKKSDPVLLISGGPGAVALTEARFAEGWNDAFKDWYWLKGRDLIVYDQRGVGGARPALECPEVDATRDEPMNIERARKAMIACRDRLAREGVDLAAYDTNANVDDILTLQARMRIAALNLWGQSYGSRVAMALMRRNANGVRSVILDGPYPPEVAGKMHLAMSFLNTLERVFEACAKDEACRTDYPDLRQRFAQAVTRLREQPAEVRSEPARFLEPRTFKVNDVLLLAVVDSLVYTADGIAMLPWVIDRVAEGKADALSDPITEWDTTTYGPYITTGMSYLVDCNDTPNPDDSEERSLAERNPLLRGWIAYAAMAFKPCPIWTQRSTPALDRAPVRSEIPTLVISGAFDHATPPEWGVVAVRSLRRGQLVMVPSRSHDAANQDCAKSALEAFLERPETDLGLYCGPAPSHPRFKRKSDDN
jgi:pimeloyl-ACP methyl ester carboxylesterase